MSEGAGKRRAATRLAIQSAARIVLTVVLVLGLYFVAPLGRDTGAAGWVTVGVGLCAIGVVVVFQGRRIMRSERPVVQAAEALTLTWLLFVTLFASTYYTLQSGQPASFGTELTKLDSLYFTVTVFATVGFGDIAPLSQLARGLVTAQMVGDLVFIGVAIRVLMEVTKRAVSRRELERR
ncbi:MAG TPA: potassium channel family protein [Actinomycetes bacterium]